MLEQPDPRPIARPRRRLFAAVAALAVAVVAVLVSANEPARSPGPTVRAGPAADPVFYTPRRLEGEYMLTTVHSGFGYRQDPVAMTRAYGRRRADGLTVDAAVMVVTSAPGKAAYIGFWAHSPVKRAGKKDVVLHRGADHFFSADQTQAVWVEPDGRGVGVLALGVGDEDFQAVAEGLVVDGAGARATRLPEGFAPIYDGPWSLRNENLADRATEQSWIGAPDGQGGEKHPEFTLEVHQGAGLSLDSVVWSSTELSAAQVAGAGAIHDPGDSSLTWQPEPGVLLVLSAPGEDEPRLRALAETIEPVDQKEWQRITLAATGGGQPDTPKSVLADGVTLGARWKVAAYQGTPIQPDGLCVELETDGGAGGECGFQAAGPTRIGALELLSSADGLVGPILVTAVGPDVAAGRLERAGGTSSAVRVTAGLGVRFLVVPLSGPPVPDAIVALDAGGRELARQDVPQPSLETGPPHFDAFPPLPAHGHPPVSASDLPPATVAPPR